MFTLSKKIQELNLKLDQTNPYFLSDIFNIKTSNSYQIKIQIGKRFCRNIINSKTCAIVIL